MRRPDYCVRNYIPSSKSVSAENTKQHCLDCSATESSAQSEREAIFSKHQESVSGMGEEENSRNAYLMDFIIEIIANTAAEK